ncbi:hypothetical protein JW877_05050 [bacterium]|nr:hypothetical protein [bacterium]
MIELEVKCPHCSNSLMDDRVKVSNRPSIVLDGLYETKRGKVFLSSVYGDIEKIDHTEAPFGELVTFFCPHCGKPLNSTSFCSICGAPMVTLSLLRAPGMGEICSRKGCPSHCIKFSDIENEIKCFYNEYHL